MEDIFHASLLYFNNNPCKESQIQLKVKKKTQRRIKNKAYHQKAIVFK